MATEEQYMQRCIDLARLGEGDVSPNPMVGCVIVSGGKIIGEGYHRRYGRPHAEVNAIGLVKDQELLKKSTLYVSLEPCSHFGKTPPCTDLIISKKIPGVVIGTIDTSEKVAGKGVEKLIKAGIDVSVGVLEEECRELNKRFFTYHEKKRPYIILKWAQTIDGFIDIDRGEEDFGEPTWITGETALRMGHKIRSAEDAILVGRKTAVKDNPSLKVYNWAGRDPVRVVLDPSLKLPKNLKLFDNSAKTLVFNSIIARTEKNTEYIKIKSGHNLLPEILDELYNRQILSLIVEGGRQLLESFLTGNLWDEIHQFAGNKIFCSGVKAPPVSGVLISEEQFDSDRLKVFRNQGA